MLRRISLISAIITTLLIASCATAPGTVKLARQIPAKYLESVQSSLNEAGENAPELIKVLNTLNGEELEWACFIIGTMPFPDLISIKANYLLEHIRYTKMAKDKYKWMAQIPEDVFLAYVLPYRMAEEPIMEHPVRSEQHPANTLMQNDSSLNADARLNNQKDGQASNGTSRKYFFEQLDPLVSALADTTSSDTVTAGHSDPHPAEAGRPTMFEVSYQVNLWLGGERKNQKQRVHFEPSEGRDKSPFATLLGSQGRCEEMMIIFMAAVRAVGIPARSVSTPYWAKCDNNHAWTEIYAENKWYPLGSCEPSIQNAMAETAGKAWFTETAATAAAIYAVQFGQPLDKTSIYRGGKKDTIINVLPNYSLVCQLDVTVLGPDSKPVSNAPVALSVVNWSVFRKVGLQKTDANGKAFFTAGIGQYMLSASNNSSDLIAWQIISTTPVTLPITLTLSTYNPPSGYYTLRFPDTHTAYVAFNPEAAKAQGEIEVPEKYKKINAEHCPAAPIETYSYNEFKPTEHPEVMELIDYSPLSTQIISVLKLSGGNWVEIAGAIQETAARLGTDPVPPERDLGQSRRPQAEFEDMLWLISTLNLVDSVEMTKEILLEHVKYAQLARKQLPSDPYKPLSNGGIISDEIYRSYVLSPRMPNLHIYQWRKDLYDMFMPVVAGSKTITEMALRINKWIETNIKIVETSSGRFFVSPNPAAVFKSKRSTTGGPIMSTVAALRSVGIPANVKESWVEFYDGAEWQPLYPMDSKNLCKKTTNEAVQQEYVKKGGVKITTTKNGLPFSTNEQNCGISRFTDGGWEVLEQELGTSQGLVSVTPGKYLLTASARNANGDVLIYARPITVTSDKGIDVTIPLDLPMEMLSTDERVVRKLTPVPDFTLTDKTGQTHNLKQALASSNVLMVFFTVESEPSIRMLPLIQAMAEKAKAAGVEIWTVLTDEKGEGDERINAISLPMLLDKDMTVTKQFIPFDVLPKKKDFMPSILLIKQNGEIMLWKEGYNLAINELLEDAFNTLSGRESAITLETLNKAVQIKEIDISGIEYNQKAEEYLLSGNYPKAVEFYSKAVTCFPDSSGIWYNYACALSRNNNIDEALNAIKKAIEFGYTNLDWIKKDPDLENLRKDERFKEIVK